MPKAVTDCEHALRDMAAAKRAVDSAHAIVLMHPGDREKSKAYHRANVSWRSKVKYCIAIGERYL